MLLAAIDLIAEKGVSGLTMSDVGIRAGYSRGLAHTHFGTREKLLSECLDLLARDFNAQRKKDGVDTIGINAIFSLVDAYTQRPESASKRIRALLFIMLDSSIAESPMYQFVHDYNQKNMAYVEFKLNEARDLGQIRTDVDTHSAALLIMSLLRGVSLHRLNSAQMVSHAATKTQLLTMLNLWLRPQISQ